ncbi:MAG: hypothetical protein MO853_12195 [Candidatus Protistobacter heckmanni]|nr:hypothetical protein [Candidatus Protistobacter heckmanni]
MDKLYEDIGKDMRIHDGFELVRILRLSFNVGSNTFFPSMQVKILKLCTARQRQAILVRSEPLSAGAHAVDSLLTLPHHQLRHRAGNRERDRAIAQIFSVPFAMTIYAGNQPIDKWLLPNRNF